MRKVYGFEVIDLKASRESFAQGLGDFSLRVGKKSGQKNYGNDQNDRDDGAELKAARFNVARHSIDSVFAQHQWRNTEISAK
jgi:hypothetical protein